MSTATRMRRPPEGSPPDSPDRAAFAGLVAGAIDREEIRPAFQPLVDLRTREILGFEVLARWRDPREGDISPTVFIPLLERYGCLDRLLEALVVRACEDAASWPGSFSLAFNVSPSQLSDGAVPALLTRTVPSTGFPLSRIVIEVTEGLLPEGDPVPGDSAALEDLAALRALGITIALDDFGTEHSNLARLESFPFHELKLDARFVRGVDLDSRKRGIASAVVSLGLALGLSVVAEGVETPAEEEALRALGYAAGQGWLYGRPEPASDARMRLERALITARGDRATEAEGAHRE